MKTLKLIISGKVQGVFFRANAKKQADKLGIKGYVKNTDENKVEILAQGSEENIKNFIEFCKQGPPEAEVTDIQIKELKNQKLGEFKIIT